MKRLFRKCSETLASIPLWLTSKSDVGTGFAEESFCDEEFDSGRCFRHPKNGGDCRHHWICDQLKRWEKKNSVSETEMTDRVQHGERAVNGKKNSQVRAGKFGIVCL